MPSLLTRNVFRRLLANEPIVHRGCLRRQTQRSVSSIQRVQRPLLRPNDVFITQTRQRRTIFGFNLFSPRQEAREADLEPGIDKMMELAKRERMRARMPPPQEVLDALTQLFEYKMRFIKGTRSGVTSRALTDTQAQLALQSLRYLLACQKQREEGVYQGENFKRMGNSFVRKIAKVLQSSDELTTTTHAELARLVYEAVDPRHRLSFNRICVAYIYTLSQTGQTSLARDILQQAEKTMTRSPVQNLETTEEEERDLEESQIEEDGISSGQTPIPFSAILSNAWGMVLNGFVRENMGSEVQQTLRKIKESGRIDQNHCSTMIDFSIQQNNLEEVRRWWESYCQTPPIPSKAGSFAEAEAGENLTKIFRWCLAKGHFDEGNNIVREAMTSNPPKPIWDAVLIWAAGTKKSVDEINRMMSVMEESNKSIPEQSNWRLPDISTINGLVELAIALNDPYMAERLITLGRDRNIEPNTKTLVLQMDYRLSVNDIDGALIAYKNLQSHDTSSHADVPAVNRLIVGLCSSGRHDFDTIMNIAADLSDRRARFESHTVSKLALMHLRRGEEDDVIDLLNTHAFHYSSAERSGIRDAIVAFCMDSKTATAAAWQAYNILKSVFDEMARPDRTKLMTAFFNRKRPDMAVHVFQNMRMHSRTDTIPTIETYVLAFLALAELRNLEGLEVVHNLLKLDYNINVNTYLNTSLMLAYSACGKPRTGLAFWEEIVASREGPTYSSIHAAFRACEKSSWGDVRAKQIWALLRKRNVELDQSLWTSYIAALAGNGDLQTALAAFEEALETGDVEVDSVLLGSLFSAMAGQVKQEDMEAFAKSKYPQQWAEVERLGFDEDENGWKTSRIDRRIEP